MAKKIYIDAGHGGDSIGAVYKGRKEQDDCLKLALAVGGLVSAQGIEVKYSRTTDVNPDLTGRCNEANKWGADYFISIHRNSYTAEQANGVEAWIYSKCAVGGATYNKAKVIVDDVCAATGFYNRGVKRGAPSYTDFAVNRVTEMDSCLLECGFISTAADNKIFDDKFSALATAIAKGLCAAVGVTYTDKPAENPGNGKHYRVQVGYFGSYENAKAMKDLLNKMGFDAIIKEE
jgi:N-acetylmuramoyl-L-alanine amidase